MDWFYNAKEIGFENISKIDIENLNVLEDVRKMCAFDKCKSYNKTWSCPPACGSLEYCQKRINEYSYGILVQTVYDLQDEFDFDGIKIAKKRHDKRFSTFVRQIKMFDKDCLPLSAGACTRCEKCTYPDKPCRYPDKMFASMEAYGLLVSDVCEKSNTKYYYGENKISFTSCVLLKERSV